MNSVCITARAGWKRPSTHYPDDKSIMWSTVVGLQARLFVGPAFRLSIITLCWRDTMPLKKPSKEQLNAKQKTFLLEVLFCHRGKALDEDCLTSRITTEERNRLFIYKYVNYYDKALFQPVELTSKSWDYITENLDKMVVIPSSPIEYAFQCMLNRFIDYVQESDINLADFVGGAR